VKGTRGTQMTPLPKINPYKQLRLIIMFFIPTLFYWKVLQVWWQRVHGSAFEP